jgi:hypothetical protein
LRAAECIDAINAQRLFPKAALKKHFETEVFVRERAMRVKERSVLPMCGAFAAPRQNSSL